MLQYSVSQSEHSLYLSKIHSEENKLKESEKNLSTTVATLRDRKT